MRRRSITVLLAGVVLLVPVSPAAAEPPREIHHEESFGDSNVCSGEPQIVTLTVTFFVHEHDRQVVARGDRTISTTTGYTGGGTSSFVMNDAREMFRFTDILANDTGSRIRARAVFLLDRSDNTTLVDEFELTCIRG